MAEGFKIADAFVSVTTEIDKRSVKGSATAAGDEVGRTMSERSTEKFEQRFARDSRGRFTSAGKQGGGLLGTSVGAGFLSHGPKLGGALSGVLKSPYVLGAVAAAGVVMAPAIMAGISGGILAGAGAGVLGLGFAIVKEEPAVKKASERLGKTTKGIFEKAAKPMIAPFAKAVGSIEGMMKRLEPKFMNMFKKMAPAIAPLTKGFTDLVEKAMPGLEKMVIASGPFLTEIAPSFGKIGEGISIFGREIAKAGPDAALFFKDLLTWTGGLIAGLGYMIGWVSRGYGEMRAFFVGIPPFVAMLEGKLDAFWSRVGAWFTGIGSSIASGYNSFIGFFVGIGNKISSFVSSVGAWFAAIPGKISSGLNAAGSFISGWANRIGAWFSALPGRIGSFLASLPGVIGGAFKTAMHAALFAVGFAIGSVIKFFIDLPGRIRGAISIVTGVVSSVFNATKARAISIATGLVNGTVNFFRLLPGRARGAMNSLISTVSGIFNSAKSGATSRANSLVNGVINFFRLLPGRARGALFAVIGIVSSVLNGAVSAARAKASSLVNGGISILRTFPGKARSALSSVRSAVTGAFAGAGGWLVSAGANIIRGLISGIRSMIGAAVNAAIDGMKSVISGAKSALGISSPSKVAEKQIGRWFMPGVAKGVVKGVPAARRTVAAATRSLVPVSPAVGGIRGHGSAVSSGSGGGATYQFAPGSIVLDASKLRTIEDVIELISGIKSTARTRYARTTSPAGA